jgi:TP53 regulating kinase-like protein
MVKLLYKKGAEAHLFKEDWYGRVTLKKIRIPKSYRHPVLDQRLRIARTIHEAKILSETRKLGISTPIVYYVDIKNAAIFMEFIEGIRVKELLNKSSEGNIEICKNIGKIIGTLHKNNIIHGDLTTSNMIVETESKKIYIIDFGLAEYSTTIESRGVDLHLIHRAFQSTHFKILKECFTAIKQGYQEILGDIEVKKIFQRLDEIENRGRYH